LQDAGSGVLLPTAAARTQEKAVRAAGCVGRRNVVVGVCVAWQRSAAERQQQCSSVHVCSATLCVQCAPHGM